MARGQRLLNYSSKCQEDVRSIREDAAIDDDIGLTSRGIEHLRSAERLEQVRVTACEDGRRTPSPVSCGVGIHPCEQGTATTPTDNRPLAI